MLDFFPVLKNTKLNSAALVERCSLHAKNEIRHLIFVRGLEVTPSVLSRLNICQEGLRVDIFNKIELMTNPLKSELVPLHRLCDETDSFLPHQRRHLSKMLSTDWIAKFCGYPVGSVVQIIYKNKKEIIKSETRIVIPAS